jgi:16S rRNA (uracil1498-N3)-methyltransferase
MDYFYCRPENIEGKELVLDGDEFSHLVHVMRKNAGEEIRVVDGKGTAYDVRLGELKKHAVRCAILRSEKQHHEPPRSVSLAVGVLKNPSKFDFLVEKAVELGVTEIIPLRSERAIARHARSDRWQKLALAAMKQCGRSFLPQVRELTPLEDLLADGSRFDLSLVAHEGAEGAGDAGIDKPAVRTVRVLIGPEGGFSESEIGAALEAGYKLLYFGNRRLRSETAAIAACVKLLV